MARRVAEQEYMAKAGTPLQPMGKGTKLEIVKEIQLHKTFGGVYSMQINPQGTVLAVGYGAGGIQAFHTSDGSLKTDIRSCRQGGYAVMSLRFKPGDSDFLYAATTEGHIYMYEVNTGELKTTIEESGNEINTLDFSVDGWNFATGGRDLNIRVYETKQNRLVRTWEGHSKKAASLDQTKVANTMRVFAIKFHPSNQYIFISGGWDNHIKIWDIRDNEGIKRNIRGPHICGDAIDMRGNNILSGQWTALHALQEIDYTSGKQVREVVYPHTDGAFLYAAQYINDETVFAGGSGTNTANVIELGTNRVIGSYKMDGPIHALDSAQNGRVLAVGGAANRFAILSLKDA